MCTVAGVVAILSERHGRSGAAVIAEANAIACGVGATAPLLVGLTVGLGWTWRPAVAVVILLALACAAVAYARRLVLPSARPVSPVHPVAAVRVGSGRPAVSVRSVGATVGARASDEVAGELSLPAAVRWLRPAGAAAGCRPGSGSPGRSSR